MNALLDKYNGNIYITGTSGGKKYIYSEVMRFRVNQERLNRLTKINITDTHYHQIKNGIKLHQQYDYDKIEFDEVI